MNIIAITSLLSVYSVPRTDAAHITTGWKIRFDNFVWLRFFFLISSLPLYKTLYYYQ